METELKEKKRRIGDLKIALRPFLPSLVQVNGEGKERATVGQMTSIELIVPISSLPSPLVDQLSCQLTDPNYKHVPARDGHYQLHSHTTWSPPAEDHRWRY